MSGKKDKMQLFDNFEKIENYRRIIKENTDKHITSLTNKGSGIEFLRLMKFYSDFGYDPLFEEPTNFLEQINQTWTYLVCLSAVEIFLKKYPDKKFWVTFGNKGGIDVKSDDDCVVCECFATTHPKNNRKLKDEAEKLIGIKAVNKYIIYYSLNQNSGTYENVKREYPEINIIELPEI